VVQKRNQKPFPSVMDAVNFMTLESVARLLSLPLAQKLCRWSHDVFIAEHYFSSKLFAALPEACSVSNKITVHRLVTTFRGRGSFKRRLMRKLIGILLFFSVGNRFERECWFQHDGATAHAVNVYIRVLWWPHCCSGIRPSRSPDLTPPDFCLWWFLKEGVYSNNRRDLH
jgi:hypothetical protein